ncbi:MAG: DUF481 domain-containing protein [Nitrospirales bacterium]|nr:DUF481 domain-containing protein [Nitrospira sp.]MDR4501611.1 DUF481 domain-containing protein [Nitrospirales bacterium]
MKQGVWGCVVLLVMMLALPAHAGVIAQVDLKDGSRLLGEIIDMTDGNLKMKAAFSKSDPISILWSEVVGITSEESMSFVLKDGIVLNGKPKMVEPGKLEMQTTILTRPLPVDVHSILAVNPPEKKAVEFTGNLNFGGSINSGNTHLKNASLLGELVARSDRMRLTLQARWIYGENDNTIIARNAYGLIKLDFFITKRFYAYTSAIFEQDTFQDLQLRTSINAGPGYQFIDVGDFTSPYLKDMKLSAEIGFGFFNEDFKVAEDKSYATGRWAVDFLWPVLPTVTFFHQHQGFPSLEDTSDFYVITQQGVRVKVWKDFISSLQINWRYDNTPSPGNKKSDFLYLLTLGYNFVS